MLSERSAAAEPETGTAKARPVKGPRVRARDEKVLLADASAAPLRKPSEPLSYSLRELNAQSASSAAPAAATHEPQIGKLRPAR